MRYAVYLDTVPSPSTPALDELQRVGATIVLTEAFDEMDPVTIDEYWLGAHPEGVIVKIWVDVDTPQLAEAVALEATERVLQAAELLPGWSVAGVNSEVALG
ncbi:hypothetical protein [Nocardia sp. NPDC052566]|uniref:hypothetical protein n=1 Tax=Nocardia sp. NPDC052566 TaxID=3364330 RepID=UPI0037C5AFC3